jgi:hypothetical protein
MPYSAKSLDETLSSWGDGRQFNRPEFGIPISAKHFSRLYRATRYGKDLGGQRNLLLALSYKLACLTLFAPGLPKRGNAHRQADQKARRHGEIEIAI